MVSQTGMFAIQNSRSRLLSGKLNISATERLALSNVPDGSVKSGFSAAGFRRNRFHPKSI
ncbi:hypothetical protein CPJ18_03425 [Agrobacterium rosae]|uniref:Uncharacterized protein n=1 Tax=Agrobacterium rosae TaxID=1972867 RepID=A0AAE5S0I3_9HYPH|nr:hypothetical protein DXM25_09795 [Agrobacterium rosae]MQB48444.1 hypothetical protein [Agrobacterium rosae]POO53314.1 hypothetical protein CPJ18_03425 [Agrobacterium rosae]